MEDAVFIETTEGPVVRVADVTKIYGRGPSAVVALNRVSVDVAPGTFTAIMGPSGSGKSSLLHAMAGLDTIDAGRVFLAGTELSGMTDKELTYLRRRRAGFVFQSFNLLPMFTAEQNILMPCQLAGVRPDREWFDTLVDALKLGDRLDHLPAEISGGQQQRVAIARALITKPDVVFADEPTGNLDTRTGAEVLAFLRQSVREFGQTVVMVTHDPSCASYASSVLLLADGRIAGHISQPSPETVLAGLEALRTVTLPAFDLPLP